MKTKSIITATFITFAAMSASSTASASDLGSAASNFGTFKLQGQVIKANHAKGTSSNSVSTAQIKRQMTFRIDNRTKRDLSAMQWSFEAGSKGRPILSGNRYRLVNAVTERGLKRQKRSLAANLGWLSKKSKAFNIKVKRAAGNGQLRYGDRVALHVKSYGWLRFKKQKWGINLSDDNHNPHYIFVVKGGTTGSKVYSGMPLVLHSVKYKTAITFCNRAYGIDLGYKGRSKCGGLLAKVSQKAFGLGGLFARDGLSGKAFTKLKDHVCKAGVTAAGAYVAAKTGGTTAKVVAATVPVAIKECKKL